MSNLQQDIEQLLWHYMIPIPGRGDAKKTGRGTKSIAGLVACLENIFLDNGWVPPANR